MTKVRTPQFVSLDECTELSSGEPSQEDRLIKHELLERLRLGLREALDFTEMLIIRACFSLRSADIKSTLHLLSRRMKIATERIKCLLHEALLKLRRWVFGENGIPSRN